MRIQDDRYPTPKWCVDRLLESCWCDSYYGYVAEPASGDGSIIRAVDERNPLKLWWIAYDINPMPPMPVSEHHRVSFEQRDFLSIDDCEQDNSVGLVITNPPYSLAEEFVVKSRRLYPNADIYMLLRLSFLASRHRLGLWKEVGTPDVFVLPNRPSFTANGKTDTSDYAWFAWYAGQRCRHRGSVSILADTPKEQRRMNHDE